MPFQHRVTRESLVTIASGANQSAFLDLRRATGGAYLVPGTFTNTGGTNLMRFTATQQLHEGGLPSGALVPTTTVATAATQQLATSSWFAIPADVFKHRFARFDGVTTEGGARSLTVVLWEEMGVNWKTFEVGIAASGTTSDSIDLINAIGGTVSILDTIWTGTSVKFEVSATGATYTALSNTSDTDISQGVPVGVTVTGGTNATPIVITATAHGLQTGNTVTIAGITGLTAANGSWTITRVDADSFSLDGSVGNGTYGGSPTCIQRRWLPIPDGAFGHRYVRLLSSGTEAAARRIRVDLKYRG